MKKVLISIISIIAFIVLIGDIEILTIKIIIAKILSLFWFLLLIKANNYFMKED